MICYRDMSFCSDADSCQNHSECRCWFSPAEEAKAVRWWGGEDAPIAFMSFKATCAKFSAEDRSNGGL